MSGPKGEICWFCANSLEPNPGDQTRRISHTVHLWSHFYWRSFCENLFLTTLRDMMNKRFLAVDKKDKQVSVVWEP